MVDVFVIDPPWSQKKGGLRKVRENQTRNLDYNTMDIKDIFSLLDDKIFPLARDNHCVFMWVIDKYLIECELEMLKRGYKRHARFIWNKQNGVAPAFTIRFTHEYLIWYYKPKLPKIATDMRGKYTSILSERGRQHSRKPDCSYQMIEDLYPNAVKMDVFSREQRHEWLQFGNQTNFFNNQS